MDGLGSLVWFMGFMMDWFKGVVGAGAGAALFRGLLLHRRVRAHLMAEMAIEIGLQHHITKLAITIKTKHRGGQN
jgi:hypothetical protein